MAYKRISPMPIIEGGTNASSYATVAGTNYYDGTRLVVTATGTAGQVLTSNGAGMAPTYQTFGSGSSGGCVLATINTGTTARFVMSSTSSTTWIAIGGRDIDTTQAANQFIVPAAGTLRSLFVIISTNTSTTDVTCTLNVNAVNTSIVATIPALTTGVFSDIANTASVSAGDSIVWEMSSSTTGTITGSISMLFGV